MYFSAGTLFWSRPRLMAVNVILISCVILLTFPVTIPGSPAPPVLVASKAGNDLLETLRTYEQRLPKSHYQLFHQINRVIDPYIDFSYMGRMILGLHWKQANALQREAFNREFRTMLIGLSSDILMKYVLGRGLLEHIDIVYLPARLVPGDTRVKVRAKLLLHGTLPFDVQLSLKKTARGWKIYDASAEGFSLVSSYRSIYDSEIRHLGLYTVIQDLIVLNTRWQRDDYS